MARTDLHRFDDLFQVFGPVSLRRFFGGEAIYAGEIIIGMIFNDTIYFKTDDDTRKAFLAERTKPFAFLKRSTGETVTTTWYAIPDRLYDDADELAEWAKAAYAVASAKEGAKRARKPAARKKRR